MCTLTIIGNERRLPCHVNQNRYGPNCNSKSQGGTKSQQSCSLRSRNSHHYYYFKAFCYNNYYSSNRAKYIKVNCYLTDQPVPSAVKCGHIVCLLLAYFALTTVSASAELVNSRSSRYSEPASVLLNLTVAQQNVSDNKTTNIPLQKDSQLLTHNGQQTKVIDLELHTSKHKHSEVDTTTTGSMNKRSPIKQLKYEALTLSSYVDNGHSVKSAEEESLSFTVRIFHRYGNNSNYLLKTNLEKLFVNIGLSHELDEHAFNRSEDGLIDGELDIHKHNDSVYLCHDLNQIAGDRTDHAAAAMLGGSDPASTNNNEHSQNVINATVTSPRTKQKCLSKDELLSFFQYDKLQQLNADEFRNLCPALIDQLDAGYCRQCVDAQTPPGLKQVVEDPGRNHQHSHDHDEGEEEGHHHHHHHTDDHEHVDDVEEDTTELRDAAKTVPAAVWCFAFLSVAIISLCSVAGVVVIPNIKRVFYNHVLQFLVALAVGAMSGDTMLHLLPHAMLSESHHRDHHPHETTGKNTTDSHHSHDDADTHEKSSHMAGLYKGLVALLGIYSFFFLERLFTLFTKSRSGKKEKKQKPRRKCRQQHEQKKQAFHMVSSRLENDGGNSPSCDEMVMVVHPNKALRAYADVSHEAYLHRCDESLVQPPTGYSVTSVLSNKENFTTLEGATNTGLLPAATLDAEIVGYKVIKDAESVASTHSHSHSHLAPDFVGSLSSVAMMVIVGDMIHNFCDGLAIGAAYAGNVAGGLSTSVAVFCHELPHEIGDFAVLVRSGLTMQKALCFNLVSSIPCFIGVIIGLTVGNVMSTSSWIFAAVGGMFLYVTLVDLIPEMSSVYTKSGEPWFLHLLLQASGIAVGTTIMLIISVYEETFLQTFN